jgi:hypothetical protein
LDRKNAETKVQRFRNCNPEARTLFAALNQGCQIFLVTTYQDVKSTPSDNKIYEIAIAYMKNYKAVKYTNVYHCKAFKHLLK